MATLTPEINLKSIIEESREIAQALCEFADNIEEKRNVWLDVGTDVEVER